MLYITYLEIERFSEYTNVQDWFSLKPLFRQLPNQICYSKWITDDVACLYAISE